MPVGVDLAVLLPAGVVFVPDGVGATSRRACASWGALVDESLAFAVPDAVLDAELAPDGVVDAVAEPDGVTAFCPQVTGSIWASSGRKFSTAAWPSRAMSLWVALGISTTSWSLPCTCTVAPVTPVVLMRSSMIWRAWLICDDVGAGEPLGTMALKMTRVPPTRSMPSLGLCGSPGNTISEYRTTNSPMSATR